MKLLIGISASIAVYKSCELTRLFKKNGHEVQVIMTPTAARWISPLVFSALSGNPVYSTDDNLEHPMLHIDITREIDCFLVAPASASLISRAATGNADTLLTTSLLACTAPVWIAPSMNPNMYHHPATIKNIETLASYGYHILKPDSGEALCGDTGEGRMMDVESIYQKITKQKKT